MRLIDLALHSHFGHFHNDWSGRRLMDSSLGFNTGDPGLKSILICYLLEQVLLALSRWSIKQNLVIWLI